jgi:hypothetical protein
MPHTRPLAVRFALPLALAAFFAPVIGSQGQGQARLPIPVQKYHRQ